MVDWFVCEKMDGISINCVYNNGKLVSAITRGDGETGEDITANVMNMGGVILSLFTNFTGSFRGEIILTKANHAKYFSDKANPRNAASGISKRLDSVGSEHLNVFFYQAIGDVDFETEEEQFRFLINHKCTVPNFSVVSSVDQAIKIWEDYQADGGKFRNDLNYDIDGLVIRINDIAKQISLGETNLRPKGAIAFKFQNESAETTLTDVMWETGNSGRITPVAIFEAVNICGAEIKKATLHNMARVKELQLYIGCKILVSRRNDVIPFVEKRL